MMEVELVFFTNVDDGSHCSQIIIETLLFALRRACTSSLRKRPSGRGFLPPSLSLSSLSLPYHFSNGAPGLAGTVFAIFSSSATSPSSSLHPRHPATLSACWAFRAPGMGTAPLLAQ